MNDSVKRLELAEFVDGETVRFVRDYPHPVERVWNALTRPAEIRVWFVPFTKLETCVGGNYAIAAPGGNAFTGTLTEFEPPRVINFNGLTRFELFESEGGCRMVVTLKRWPNGWSPLQLAGFHAQFDQLELHLNGTSKETIEKTVDTWRHVFPAYELLVQRNVTAGRKVHHRVHFGPNLSALSDGSEPVLDQVLRVLRENPGIKIELDGHCDDPCSMEQSVKLARDRMAAVSRYLEAQGVAADRIMTIGGSNNLHRLVPSDTEEGRAFNRRVDLRPIY